MRLNLYSTVFLVNLFDALFGLRYNLPFNFEWHLSFYKYINQICAKKLDVHFVGAQPLTSNNLI